MNTLHERLAECDALRARLGSLRPLPVEALKKIEDALNIEYTYESNRIEGNTLTLQETALVVNDYIKDFARNDTEISERTIKEIHAIVLHGIDRENAGRYRTVPVMISGSTHTPPQPYLIAPQMEAFMLRFAQMEAAKEHPIIIAAYLHDELVRIHPFVDGNGRTSRLLMNLYLLRHGYTLVNLKGSNEAKAAYYKALESSHTEQRPEEFRQLVAKAEADSLRRYLSIIGGEETKGTDK